MAVQCECHGKETDCLYTDWQHVNDMRCNGDVYLASSQNLY